MDLILDIGSGRSLNNVDRAKSMIEKVAAMDSHKHKIVFKAQLFKEAPPNIPLDLKIYEELYHYARGLGYEMTASVFDMPSLQWLLCYNPVFVKIACRPDLYWLIGEVPRSIPVYASWCYDWPEMADETLACISQYPAKLQDYFGMFSEQELRSISDHTVGWELYRRANPRILEKHLCPKRESDNPDSSPFAVTPEELREII